MADIQSRILGRYGIDIAQDNILKIYKIDQADLSPEELEQKINDTRKRLNGSVNGANEKLAERARGRLEKAPKYEEILRNDKLRKELFQYYDDPSGGGSKTESSSGGGNTAFAKEFFQLVGTTKKVNKKDIEFYFKYFQSERKNKKAILEMLEKDLKVRGVGSEQSYADENETVDEEGKKQDDSPLIVSLFTEATILKVHRVIEKYGELMQNETVRKRYPELDQGIYKFLELDKIEDAEQFSARMAERGKEAYAVRQEHGAEYVPLVDLFNILQTLSEYKDVADNIPAFKLLLQYPNLTPYMYSFVNMKPVTVKEITDIANRDYKFRDQTDFILTYYNPIHKNFGIMDSGIAAILKKAEQSAKKNKVLNGIDEKLGRDKNKRKIPFWAEMIHWLVYWPIFIVYLAFEAAKVIFTQLHRLALPVGIVVLVVTNKILPPIVELENLAVFRRFFLKNQWLSYLQAFFRTDTTNWFQIILMTLIVIGLTLLIYTIPAGTVTLLLYMFADDLNKRFDWDGLERTFRQIFMNLRRKTEDRYFTNRDAFVRGRIPKIISNMISLLILSVLLNFAGGGLKTWSANIHFGKKDAAAESSFDTENAENGEELEESGLPEGRTMVITASSANIRSGPGTDYPVLTTAGQGNTFTATGNEETASNGRTWYEIYINDGQTGWASQKVITFQ